MGGGTTPPLPLAVYWGDALPHVVVFRFGADVNAPDAVVPVRLADGVDGRRLADGVDGRRLADVLNAHVADVLDAVRRGATGA